MISKVHGGELGITPPHKKHSIEIINYRLTVSRLGKEPPDRSPHIPDIQSMREKSRVSVKHKHRKK